MAHITSSRRIAAPVEAVFAFVDDYRNTTRYMKDLTRWAPAGAVTHGQGASFEVAMKAGPLTLSSVVDITTWAENSTIGWTSTDGFKQTGRWSFRASGDGTDATFDLEYALPGGIAGRLLSRAAEPVVRTNIDQSVRNLKTQVERAVRRPVSTPRVATETPRPTPKAASPSPSKRAPAPKAAAAKPATKQAPPRKAATPAGPATRQKTAASTKTASPRKPASRPKG